MDLLRGGHAVLGLGHRKENSHVDAEAYQVPQNPTR